MRRTSVNWTSPTFWRFVFAGLFVVAILLKIQAVRACSGSDPSYLIVLLSIGPMLAVLDLILGLFVRPLSLTFAANCVILTSCLATGMMLLPGLGPILGVYLYLPVPVPMLMAFVGFTAWAFVPETPIRLDVCQHCGYCVDGLAAGALCPECGRKPNIDGMH